MCLISTRTSPNMRVSHSNANASEKKLYKSTKSLIQKQIKIVQISLKKQVYNALLKRDGKRTQAEKESTPKDSSWEQTNNWYSAKENTHIVSSDNTK